MEQRCAGWTARTRAVAWTASWWTDGVATSGAVVALSVERQPGASPLVAACTMGPFPKLSVSFGVYINLTKAPPSPPACYIIYIMHICIYGVHPVQYFVHIYHQLQLARMHATKPI